MTKNDIQIHQYYFVPEEKDIFKVAHVGPSMLPPNHMKVVLERVWASENKKNDRIERLPSEVEKMRFASEEEIRFCDVASSVSKNPCGGFPDFPLIVGEHYLTKYGELVQLHKNEFIHKGHFPFRVELKNGYNSTLTPLGTVFVGSDSQGDLNLIRQAEKKEDSKLENDAPQKKEEETFTVRDGGYYWLARHADIYRADFYSGRKLVRAWPMESKTTHCEVSIPGLPNVDPREIREATQEEIDFVKAMQEPGCSKNAGLPWRRRPIVEGRWKTRSGKIVKLKKRGKGDSGYGNPKIFPFIGVFQSGGWDTFNPLGNRILNEEGEHDLDEYLGMADEVSKALEEAKEEPVRESMVSKNGMTLEQGKYYIEKESMQVFKVEGEYLKRVWTHGWRDLNVQAFFHTSQIEITEVVREASEDEVRLVDFLQGGEFRVREDSPGFPEVAIEEGQVWENRRGQRVLTKRTGRALPSYPFSTNNGMTISPTGRWQSINSSIFGDTDPNDLVVFVGHMNDVMIGRTSDPKQFDIESIGRQEWVDGNPKVTGVEVVHVEDLQNAEADNAAILMLASFKHLECDDMHYTESEYMGVRRVVDVTMDDDGEKLKIHCFVSAEESCTEGAMLASLMDKSVTMKVPNPHNALSTLQASRQFWTLHKDQIIAVVKESEDVAKKALDFFKQVEEDFSGESKKN